MSHKEKAKVFITHSWRDIAFTRQLTEDLKNEGLDVWFDEKSVAAGGRVAEEIN